MAIVDRTEDEIDWKIENFTFIDSESIENEWTSSLSSLFDEEKRTLLNKLPDAYKNRFRDAGFYKERPVLVISPYDVPHGKLRRDWMEAFFKAVHWIDKKPKKFLKNMPYLIHDFQCDRASPEHSVSLAPGNEILSMQEGSEQDLDMLPKRLARQAQFSINAAITSWTEDEQKLYLGLQNFFASTNEKEAPFALPWPEPHRDCDVFQFVEGGTIPVNPSETVDPRGNQEFGTEVILVGACDRQELVKVVKYHGDFTLVEYSNGQRQWLPLQNQQKVESATGNRGSGDRGGRCVGKVLSCSIKEAKESSDESAKGEEDMGEHGSDVEMRLNRERARNSQTSSVDNGCPPTACVGASKSPTEALQLDNGPDSSTGNAEETTIRVDEPVEESKRSTVEKRLATALPRKAKVQRLESVSLLAKIAPVPDTATADVVNQRSPPELLNGALSCQRKVNLESPARDLKPSESPLSSPRHLKNERRQSSDKYEQMEAWRLEKELDRRKPLVTMAVLAALYKRPWSSSYNDTSIPMTVEKLERTSRYRLYAAMTILAWNIDANIEELSAFVAASARSKGDSTSGIKKTVQMLLELRRSPSFAEVASHCDRMKRLASAIEAADDRLRQLGARGIAREDRTRLLGDSEGFRF